MRRQSTKLTLLVTLGFDGTRNRWFFLGNVPPDSIKSGGLRPAAMSTDGLCI